MTVDISLSGASRESHKQPLYCVAFSTDTHVGHFEMKGRPTDEEEEKNDKNQEEEEEEEGEIMPQELQRRPIKEANVIYIDDSSDEDYREVIETIPSATNQHPTNKHMLELNSTNHDMDIQDETTAKSPLASSRTSSDRNSSGRVEYSFHYYHMATCGGNFLTLYQLKVPDRNNKSGKRGTFINNTGNSVNTCINSTLTCDEECEDFVVRQVYKDVDAEENFFTCIFAGRSRTHGAKVYLESSDDENAFGPQLCCVGGKQGLIKVIDTVKQSLIFTLLGHTDELYDMKRCPVNEWLLLSASNDETIRLWNLKYPSQIAIFAGHQGHREAVLSIDWHPFGKYFASSGMDGTIRLWSIEEPNVQNAIEKSFKSPLLVEEISSCCFKTVYHQIPFWITSKMHTDYVDCISFVGDLILSKSTTSVVSLWKPILCVGDKNQLIESNDTSSSTSSNNEVLHLLDYSVPDCGQWYIRFGVDSDCNLLAVGNCIGDIRVWEIGGAKKPNIVFNAMCSAIVRMTAFSPDGKMMVAVCDDSTVWKYRIS